jgi:deoxycytidine triphosphate deaminase
VPPGPFDGSWLPPPFRRRVAETAPTQPVRLPEFAKSPAEATQRYEQWKTADPFPRIAPALLNSADLLDYVAAVGMLEPYAIPENDTSTWVKSASCALPCSGEFVRYESPTVGPSEPRMIEGPVEKKQGLQLPRNSITYLLLGTTFRLPNYIAARFNLTIREIHRGILVGTGPLVDPGFEGRLLIPLHNLTNNPYRIDLGEPLVWVEFTKLSFNESWRSGQSLERHADFVPFPRRKIDKRKTAEDYLEHAHHRQPITSSVDAIDIRSQRTERVVRDTRRFSVGVAVGVIALIATLFAGAVGAFVYTLTYTNGQVGDGKRAIQQVTTLRAELCRGLPEDKVVLRCPAAAPTPAP